MDASTWVPLVTAAVGLIAGLAAGLVSTILARRWAREDRAEQWQREDALRWQRDRLQAYARMIAALHAWEAEAGQLQSRLVRAVAKGGGRVSFDAAEWDRHKHAVHELIAQLQLMAPEEVTDRAWRCLLVFSQIRDKLVDAKDADLGQIHAAPSAITQAIVRLVEAMRADLGLGGEPGAAGAEPGTPG